MRDAPKPFWRCYAAVSAAPIYYWPTPVLAHERSGTKLRIGLCLLLSACGPLPVLASAELPPEAAVRQALLDLPAVLASGRQAKRSNGNRRSGRMNGR